MRLGQVPSRGVVLQISLASGSLQAQPAPGDSEVRRGVWSAITSPRYAYQAAMAMYGDQGGGERPSCTIAAFAPGR